MQETVSSGFRIGTLNLVLKDYTTELEQGFTEFKAVVFNDWGNDLNNVYSKLSLEEKELLQTPSISVGPWKEAELKGIINLEVPVGKHQGELTLFYESKTKTEPVTITVIEKKAQAIAGQAVQLIEEAKKERDNAFLFVILGVIMVIVIGGGIVGFILHKRRESGGGSDGW